MLQNIRPRPQSLETVLDTEVDTVDTALESEATADCIAQLERVVRLNSELATRNGVGQKHQFFRIVRCLSAENGSERTFFQFRGREEEAGRLTRELASLQDRAHQEENLLQEVERMTKINSGKVCPHFTLTRGRIFLLFDMNALLAISSRFMRTMARYWFWLT